MADDGGFFWIDPTVWSYNIYQDAEEFVKYRALPKSIKDECNAFCAPHALVKCLESVLRIARGNLRPDLKTPSLSIQQLIDMQKRLIDSLPGGFQTLIGGYQEFRLAKLLKSEGVTTEKGYPFVGSPNANVNYNRRTWSYHVSEIKEYYGREYKPRDTPFMTMLFKENLEPIGPFIGYYFVRGKDRYDMKETYTTTNNPIFIEKYPDGKMKPRVHVVMITGIGADPYGPKKSPSTSKASRDRRKAVWVFQDCHGPDVGHHGGMGFMYCDVLHRVTVIKASVCGRITYAD